MAPNDIPTLVWFADQGLNLKDRPGLATAEILAEATGALEHAAEIVPEQAGLWLKLGQTWLKMGKRPEAQKAFEQLAGPNLTSSQAMPSELIQAAQGLLQIGAPATAAECLERALEKSHIQSITGGPGLLEILSLLAEARSQQGNLEEALSAINQAIKIDAQQPGYHIEKARLLLKSGGSKEEIHACIQTALKLSPQDLELHQQAVLIFQAGGDLAIALDHAVQMMRLSAAAPGIHLVARTLAADLAAATLQNQRARSYLNYEPPAAPNLPINDLPVLTEYYCQRTELALDEPQDHTGWEELPNSTGSLPDQPRYLALQAHHAALQKDPQTAAALLHASFEGAQKSNQVSLATMRAQAQAALALQSWEIGFDLLRQVCSAAPFEPRTHLSLVRALVVRAEFQRLCESLEIVQRSPGEGALALEAYHEFEAAIQTAQDLLKPFTKSEIHPVVLRWRARGQAAFHPDQESALALASLPLNPQDTAARIACLHRLGEISAAGMAAREFPQHPLVLLQLAIALAQEKPRQAMAAIHVAADTLAQADSHPHARPAASVQNIQPLVQYLTARLFHNNGNRSSDQQSAIKAINAALGLWPDEPRWHILAAEICLKPDPTETPVNVQEAIDHLQKAVQFEPDNALPYLSLGEIFLKAGLLAEAIQAFEQAGQIAPDDVRAWMWMARAYRLSGDIETAAARAERAVTLAPNQIEPLLLRGEIALDANNPRGAHSRAQAALRIQPENPDALLLMARTLNGLERTDEALEMLDRALPLAAEPLPLSLERVRMLRQAKGAETALQAALQLGDRYPEESAVQALLAELMENAGQEDKAIRAAQRALRHGENNPTLSDQEQAQLHYLLGRLLHRAGQLDQAVHHLTEAIRQSPKLVEAYLDLGQTHQERRQHNLAMTVYQQAIQVAPQDHRAYYLVGLAMKESKDYLGAEKMLRRATELAPDDLAIHRMLAAVVALNLVHSQSDPLRDIRMNRVS